MTMSRAMPLSTLRRGAVTSTGLGCFSSFPNLFLNGIHGITLVMTPRKVLGFLISTTNTLETKASQIDPSGLARRASRAPNSEAASSYGFRFFGQLESLTRGLVRGGATTT